MFLVTYNLCIYSNKLNIGCLQRGEQTGVQQCPGIIILLKYATSNLSKNSIMDYSLFFIGSHVKFQQGPPMFLVT